MAAAGGGGAEGVRGDDSHVMSELTSKFITLQPGIYKLKLTINVDKRKQYTTTFTITKRKENNRIEINNGCIEINLDDLIPTTSGGTEITKNSEDKKCFEPVLESEARGGITTTDVLQVLKTKFLLMLGRKDITLRDNAKYNNILNISTFNLLRGKPGLYEKYGYKSDIYSEFRREIFRKTFDEIKNYKYGERTVSDVVTELLGKTPDDTEKITDVFNKIDFLKEYKLINETYEMFSQKIIYKLFDLTANYLIYKFATFTLDLESPQWKHWNSTITIDKYELEAPTNGGRRLREQRRRSRRKQKRRGLNRSRCKRK